MRGYSRLSLLIILISVLITLTSVVGQESVRLIAGFERDEVQQWAASSSHLEYNAISDTSFTLTHSGVKEYLMTKKFAAQGEYALTEEIDLSEFVFRQTMLDPNRKPDATYGDREWYIEMHGFLFHAFQCFRDVFNKDWSSWDNLWIDIRSADASAIIRVIIEDRWLASDIRRFNVPAGQTVTINFKLKDVSTIGNIDLTDMANFWITLEETDGPSKIFVDNVRLALSSAQKNDGIPFVTDDSPIKKREIPEVKIDPINRNLPLKNKTPIQNPITPITINELIPSGYPFLGGTGGYSGRHERAISAYDNDNLLILMVGKYNNTFGIYALCSTDGGNTWKGIDGSNNPTYICNGRNVMHHAVFENSKVGDGYLFTMQYCYAVGGLANAFFYRISFIGDHWILSPEIISYNHVRHCPELFAFTRTNNGKLWFANENWSTIGGREIHGMLSMNEGEKWERMTKMPLVNVGSIFSGGGPFMTSYQQEVACLWSTSYNELSWAYCDGNQWIKQGLVAKTNNTVIPASIVTILDNLIFLAYKSGGELYVSHLYESKWQSALIDNGSDGRILRPILTSVGKIPYCIWGREISTSNYGIFYRRYNLNQGIWEQTGEIISGENDEIYNLAAPAKSPDNYIPLLYDSAPYNDLNSDEYWLKFIKIPVDTILAPAIPKLASPLKGSSHQDSTITLKWHPAPDADTYRLQLDKDGSFLSPIVDLQGFSDTASVITHLDPNTTYYWRAIAINGAGNSLWSEIWNFNVTVVPVELSFFSANLLETAVELNWMTVSETNNYGFEIQQGENKSDFVTIGFVKGFGTSLELHKYAFIDNNVNNGIYYYRLKQIDFDGKINYSIVIEVTLMLPDEFILEQNYPNPFNATTMIKFTIPGNKPVPIILKIVDINGREVKKLLNTEKKPGLHHVFWDAKDNRGMDISNGVYFVVIEANRHLFSKKLILIK